MTLNFDGYSIYEHGVNGSYNLTSLLLYDENGTLTDNRLKAYNTSTYNYIDFQRHSVPPPGSIINLQLLHGSTYINLIWINPSDPDFSHIMLFLNGTFLTNVMAPQNYYNITGLSPDTLYELGTHTVDSSGNVNETWVNATARKAPISDITYSISLKSGWNLFSVPFNITIWNLGDESVVGNPLNVTPLNSLTSIYLFNSTSDVFEKSDHIHDWGWWPAAGPVKFTEMEPGRGYWVNATNIAVWRHKS